MFALFNGGAETLEYLKAIHKTPGNAVTDDGINGRPD